MARGKSEEKKSRVRSEKVSKVTKGGSSWEGLSTLQYTKALSMVLNFPDKNAYATNDNLKDTDGIKYPCLTLKWLWIEVNKFQNRNRVKYLVKGENFIIANANNESENVVVTTNAKPTQTLTHENANELAQHISSSLYVSTSKGDNKTVKLVKLAKDLSVLLNWAADKYSCPVKSQQVAKKQTNA